MNTNYRTDLASFTELRKNYARLVAAIGGLDAAGESGLTDAVNARRAEMDADSFTLRLYCAYCGQPTDVTTTLSVGIPDIAVCINCEQDRTNRGKDATRHNYRADGRPCFHARCGGAAQADVSGIQAACCGHYYGRGSVRYDPVEGEYWCRTWNGCQSLEADRQLA